MSIVEELLHDLEPYNGVLPDKCAFFYEKSGFKGKKYDFNSTLRLNAKLIKQSNFVMNLMDNKVHKELLQTNPFEALKVYWKEILERVHELNLISIQRNLKWFEGIMLGVQYENLFVFSASYRGLIESISDALDALKYVNRRLPEKEKTINKVMDGSLKVIRNGEHLKQFIDGELENTLIHFTHARDVWGEKEPPNSHKKKKFHEYADNFEPEYSEAARKAWRELCQFTHPSHSSVAAYILPQDNDGKSWKIGLDHDFLQILMFTYKHKNLLSRMCEEYLVNVLYSTSLLDKYEYSKAFQPKLAVALNNDA